MQRLAFVQKNGEKGEEAMNKRNKYKKGARIWILSTERLTGSMELSIETETKKKFKKREFFSFFIFLPDDHQDDAWVGINRYRSTETV